MATVDKNTEHNIQINAELVVKQMQKLSGIAFGYDAASVSWLDGYINRNRKQLNPDTIEKLVMIFASYLGECIIRAYGGRWDYLDDELAVKFNEKNAVYPFSKVRKQFANGEEDSLFSLFELIPTVFAGHIEPAT